MPKCCCCISALVLNCFRLKKGRASFLRPETIVASFLHSMALLPKVLFNHLIRAVPFRLPNVKYFYSIFKTLLVSRKTIWLFLLLFPWYFFLFTFCTNILDSIFLHYWTDFHLVFNFTKIQTPFRNLICFYFLFVTQFWF